ncbi:MAG: histidine kinase [Flavobacteriales bacterium]|nr:histidine kinase [Flavobacteriales bacterium]
MSYTHNNMSQKSTKNILLFAIHIIGWGLLFAFPLLMSWQDSEKSISINWYLGYISVPVSFMIIFYINYFGLIPRYLFNGKFYVFIIVNIALVAIIWYSDQMWKDFYMHNIALEAFPKKGRKGEPDDMPRMLFLARDMVAYIMTVGLAVAIKMTSNWYKTVEKSKEIENQSRQAELMNLKNQLNPHFLFNTLNNIYSLIEIDPSRAQNAIHELSGLLRYALYENTPTFVPLDKEMDFLRSYIHLMKLRTGTNVHVNIDISASKGSTAQVAPLLFIALVENAFKHGVSATEDSFIDIKIVSSEKKIQCTISNSNYPKTDNDRSGSGIGIKNLKRRLDLIYPQLYTFTSAVKDNTYTTTLIVPEQ